MQLIALSIDGQVLTPDAQRLVDEQLGLRDIVALRQHSGRCDEINFDGPGATLVTLGS